MCFYRYYKQMKLFANQVMSNEVRIVHIFYVAIELPASLFMETDLRKNIKT